MTELPKLSLDPVLHQPIRTQMVAFLCAREEASFSEIKDAVEATDGNMDAHMKKLVQAGYVAARKVTFFKRSVTVYALTDAGRAAFKEYVETLKTMLDLSALR